MIPQDATSNEACRTVSILLLWRLCCGNCSDVLHEVSASDSSWSTLSAVVVEERSCTSSLFKPRSISNVTAGPWGPDTHKGSRQKALSHPPSGDLLSRRTEVNYAVIRVNVTTFSAVCTGNLAKDNQ